MLRACGEGIKQSKTVEIWEFRQLGHSEGAKALGDHHGVQNENQRRANEGGRLRPSVKQPLPKPFGRQPLRRSILSAKRLCQTISGEK